MKLIRVGAAVLNQTPLDWDGNRARLSGAIADARQAGVSVLCLPELCITGYGCEDAFHAPGTQQMALSVLEELLPETRGMIVSLGLPLLFHGALYNTGCLVADGKILGFVGKQNLAGEGIHYEPRWFKPWPEGVRVETLAAGAATPLGDLIFDLGGIRLGYEICEDAWVADRPGGKLARHGVDLILNPSASHFAFGKHEIRKRFVTEGSRAFNVGYVYANLLAMTHVKNGGFVTSVDSVTGDARVFFCNREFGNIWHGGIEVGTGWCLGSGCGCGCPCACNALELVYWGIFPATGTAQFRDDTTSTIDFGALDYNGANANVPFTDSELQRVQYSFNFNSVEANIVGNGMCGGPFGCGMCGCCNGRGGSPWGFGYVMGFRYINLSDRFLFSADPSGFGINGDPQELNYVVASNNNLFGFQMGGGLSYCVTNALTAYTIGKAGIYNNHVTQLQQVYGTAGNAVINTGAFAGQDFLIRSSDDVLSVSGQVDVGGRWAFTNQLSLNFGYRVLGLAGVAIAETQVHHNEFHNVDGIRNIQSTGSFIMHGAYLGAVYCF